MPTLVALPAAITDLTQPLYWQSGRDFAALGVWFLDLRSLMRTLRNHARPSDKLAQFTQQSLFPSAIWTRHLHLCPPPHQRASFIQLQSPGRVAQRESAIIALAGVSIIRLR